MGGSGEFFFFFLRITLFSAKTEGGGGQPSDTLRGSTENDLPINCQ